MSAKLPDTFLHASKSSISVSLQISAESLSLLAGGGGHPDRARTVDREVYGNVPWHRGVGNPLCRKVDLHHRGHKVAGEVSAVHSAAGQECAAIAAGNTFYPIFLRAYIWSISMFVPKDSEMHHTLAFLMHHPRRCYLWLFNRKTAWVLTAVQIGLIVGEWVLFEILNIDQTAVWSIPPGERTMTGLYQSFGTRSSGYYLVTISSIAPSLKIVYMIVMYLSVFPLIISLRSTNIYEERSVGLEADPYEVNQPDKDKSQSSKQGPSAGIHTRNQLAYDLWWIALAWILITIIEEPQLNDAVGGYNNFTILFEIVSAYGNCGLTMGVPYDSVTLSGTFHVLSKLVLIAVMLRGRHRILPLAIDRSILLPGQGLMEEMDKHYNPSLREQRNMEDKVLEAERGSQAEGEDSKQDPEEDRKRTNEHDI